MTDTGLKAEPEMRAAHRGGYYSGDWGPVFGKAFGGTLLAAITLGVYWFWLRTRLRSYYWSNARVLGQNMEYVGRGLEMFVGGMIAALIVAIYLVIVFFVLNVLAVLELGESDWSVLVSLGQTALLPLLIFTPYVRFRAQRYFMSRLRWRGVRFGVGRGALTYYGRSILWFVAQILTLGLATPYAAYSQRAFITRRSFFGDAPFKLSGSPWGLYPSFTLMWLSIAALVALLIWNTPAEVLRGDRTLDMLDIVIYMRPIYGLVALGLFVITIFFFWYSACRTAYFVRHTNIGDADLRSGISGWPIFWATIRKWLAIIFIGGVLSSATFFVLNRVVQGFFVGGPNIQFFLDYVAPATGIVGGLIVSAVVFAFHHAIYETSRMRTAFETLTVGDPAALEAVRQTKEQEASDAGGFAEAVGADAF